MTHRRARRLLSSLPDGLLAPASEAAVRGHVARCPRCRRALAELEMADAWLRRLPAALVPLEPSAAAEARLERLARWSAAPSRPAAGAWAAGPAPRGARLAAAGRAPLRPGTRWGIPAVGAAAAAACLAVVLATVVPAPPSADEERDEAFNFVLASSFSEGPALAGGPRHAMTGAIRPAVAQSRESESYFLPVGVR